MDKEYSGYYDRGKIVIFPIIYWSVVVSCSRRWDVVRWEPATRFTLLENIKILCKIQVIINPLINCNIIVLLNKLLNKKQHYQRKNSEFVPIPRV